MLMTFSSYIQNPMGVKNSVYSNREMYKTLYTDKLDKILVREMGKIEYTLYTDKDNYYAHFKIPSEIIPKFYYDIVIEFYTTEPTVKVSRDLKNYYIKFYSNDPSFVFTFCHAFLKNDLFVRDLVPRMSKEAVKKAAVEKNPKNEVGYVKSLYFAYLTMNRYKLFEKIQYETYGKSYNKKELIKNIMHADEKIEKRQEAAVMLNASKKKEKKTTSTQRTGDIVRIRKNPDMQLSMETPTTKKPLTAKRTSVTKKAKRV